MFEEPTLTVAEAEAIEAAAKAAYHDAQQRLFAEHDVAMLASIGSSEAHLQD
jgi:hypothetical protein